MRNIYLVNRNKDKEIMLIVDSQPKILGPGKTETVMTEDVTIRIVEHQMVVVTVECKGHVSEDSPDA